MNPNWQSPDEQLVKPRNNRRWAYLLLFATLLVLGLLIAGIVVAAFVANKLGTSARSLSNTSIIEQYPVTKLATTNLPPLISPSNSNSHLLINAQVQISNGLTLTPNVAPSSPTAGELYYDQKTNLPYYYNGTAFIALQPAGGGIQSNTFVTNNNTFVTNSNSFFSSGGPGAFVTLQPTTPGTPDTGNFNISGVGVLGQLQASRVSVKGSSSTVLQVQDAAGSSLFTLDTANEQIVLGNDGNPTPLTIRGGVATGTDASGANLTFDASDGTGAGGSGDLIFRTASNSGSLVQLDSGSVIAGGSLGNTATFIDTIAPNNNRLLMVSIIPGDGPIANVTWNGTALTQLASEPRCTPAPFSNCGHEVWYLLNPASGTHSLVITVSSSSGSPGLLDSFTESFYNVDQNTPFGQLLSQTGNTASVSQTVSTNLHQLVFDSLYAPSGITNPGSGQSELQCLNINGSNFSCEVTKPSTAPTTTVTYSLTFAAPWSEITVPLIPVPANGPDPLLDRLHITSSGNVGIDTSSPQYTLDVQGDINTSGGRLRINAVDINTAGTLSNVAYLNQANTFKPGLASTTAFQIQNPSGNSLFTVDSSNTAIVLGNDNNPSPLTIRGGAATGTNVAGANLTFDASNGTGAGGSGDLIFRTAPIGGRVNINSQSVVSQNSGNGVTTQAFNTTVAADANRMLAVMVNFVGFPNGNPVPNVTSVTWGATSLTKLYGVLDSCAGSSSNSVEVWYLLNPGTGTQTVRVNFNTNFGSANVVAAELYNVSPSTPFGSPNQQCLSSGNPISLTTSSSSGQLMLDSTYYALGGFAAATVASGQTLVGSAVSGAGQLLVSTEQAGALNTTTGYTGGAGSGNWIQTVVAVNPVATGLSAPDALSDRLHIAASGNIGLSNSDPQYTLDAAGDINTSTVYRINGLDINAAGTLSNVAYLNQTNTFTNTNLFKPGFNTGTAFQIQNSAGTNLLNADTTNMFLTVLALGVTTTLSLGGHLITTGISPSISPGVAACTSPTVNVVGNDTAGQITVTTGTACGGAGLMATVTFVSSYGASPHVLLSPDSAQAAALLAYVTTSAAHFLLSSSNSPTNSTTYVFDYFVAQ